MEILIVLLRAVLVVNSAFLLLLILIQLPKKESGSGLAFGGGALDMALGAGAGNVLTKATKWSATMFLGLCLLLAVMGNPGGGGIKDALAEQPGPVSDPLKPTIPSGQSPNFNTVPTPTETGVGNAPAQAEIETSVPEEISGAVDTSPPAPATPEQPAEVPSEKPADKPVEKK